jgi:hypothetical protein
METPGSKKALSMETPGPIEKFNPKEMETNPIIKNPSLNPTTTNPITQISKLH